MPAYDGRFSPPAPIAMVSIRHPDSGESVLDVPMLIDSGADVTLLPQSAVASLGVATTGERYELLAFDGTTSDSEVVRTGLIFMNRRFLGRFLLIDAEAGVLGRDVLNHLRLMLDGPNSRWEVGPQTALDG